MKRIRTLAIAGAAVAAVATSAAIFRRQLPESPAALHREARGRHYWLFRELGAKSEIDWSQSNDAELTTVWNIYWPSDPDTVYRLVMKTDPAGRATTTTECEALTVAFRNQKIWRQMLHIFGDVGFKIQLNCQTVAGISILDVTDRERYPNDVWQVQFGKTSDGTDFWRSDDDMVVATIADRTSYEGGACPLNAVYIAADQVVRLPDEATVRV